MPELLSDAGTVARRITALSGRGENAGAMMLRAMVLGVRERYGDGAATAAVLARVMVREAARMMAAGAHPQLMRRGMERGVAAAITALEAQAQPVEGQEMLTRLAWGMTGDAELAAILGELFDLLGAHAAVVIEQFAAPYLDRAYVAGGRWPACPAARLLMPADGSELTLHNPLVLVADALATVEQVRPALDYAATAPERPPLLVVAGEVSDEALQTLTVNHARGTLVVGAALLTSAQAHLDDDLGDVAVLTGAELLSAVLGRPPERMEPCQFGRAQRVTLDRASLTIAGGAGAQPTIRQRMGTLRAQQQRLPQGHGDREHVQMRIARLAGGVGVLKIGAYTDHERDLKVDLAKRALPALRAALEEGVVPGGGTAYLACIPAVLRAQPDGVDGAEARGRAIVAAGLEAPFAQIVCNHGLIDPRVALAEVQRLGPGIGFNAATGEYACMRECGVLDSVGVARGALEAAASVAGMMMTTERIVFVR